MSVSVPPGRRHELDLSERLADIGTEVDTIRESLPSVNDPDLHRRVAALAGLAAELVAAHTQPGPDVAEALAGLLSAARALRVPARDPELGRTPTLDGLRAVQGRLVMAVTDALDAAGALGLRPRHLPAIQEQAVEIPRAGNEGLLRGIADRLDDVAQRLGALEATRAEPTIFVQQTGLLNVYLRAMRVEIDLARLQLTIGDTTVDFGALSRAAEAMAGLTSDFVATVRAWIGRVSDAVVRGAEELPGRVRRVATGVRTAARWIVRRAWRGNTSPQTVAPSTSSSDAEDARPSDFDMQEVHHLILADQPVPAAWIPFITELSMSFLVLPTLRRLAALTSLQNLDLTGTQVSDVAPLAALTSLQSLNLRDTQVSDVAPLAALTSLQSLDLWGTQVSNVAPLAALTSMQSLDLWGTQVSDVAPLAALTSLQSLNLRDTQVSNVAPLAALTSLQSLNLWGTQVSNVAPLAALTSMQSLDLMGTQVSDVAPLAALTSLQGINLTGTQVSDVAPLAALTSMQSLDLWGTQVSDVAPLAALTSLQSLNLRDTQVSNVAPLAALTSLQSLNLRDTQVSNVAPLAALTSLQSLDLMGTQVSDVAPLAALTNLQSLNLRDTQVGDVTPLAALTNLQSLDLMGTRVSDVAPLAALTRLQSLGLWNTQVSDVAPLAALTSLRRLDLRGTAAAGRTVPEPLRRCAIRNEADWARHNRVRR